MGSNKWRTGFPQDSRQKIVKRMMDTFQWHMPPIGSESMAELLKIAWCFEEKIYQAATDQVDYLRKISQKMLSLERGAQSNPLNPFFFCNGLVEYESTRQCEVKKETLGEEDQTTVISTFPFLASRLGSSIQQRMILVRGDNPNDVEDETKRFVLAARRNFPPQKKLRVAFSRAEKQKTTMIEETSLSLEYKEDVFHSEDEFVKMNLFSTRRELEEFSAFFNSEVQPAMEFMERATIQERSLGSRKQTRDEVITLAEKKTTWRALREAVEIQVTTEEKQQEEAKRRAKEIILQMVETLWKKFNLIKDKRLFTVTREWDEDSRKMLVDCKENMFRYLDRQIEDLKNLYDIPSIL